MSSMLVGKWELESSENFDEYLKAVGIGFVLRKLALTVKPIVHIIQNGSSWTLKFETTLKTGELKFEEGVEFVDKTIDGRDSRAIFRSDGANKLVEERRDMTSNEVRTTITRHINGTGNMVIVSRVD